MWWRRCRNYRAEPQAQEHGHAHRTCGDRRVAPGQVNIRCACREGRSMNVSGCFPPRSFPLLILPASMRTFLCARRVAHGHHLHGNMGEQPDTTNCPFPLAPSSLSKVESYSTVLDPRRLLPLPLRSPTDRMVNDRFGSFRDMCGQPYAREECRPSGFFHKLRQQFFTYLAQFSLSVSPDTPCSSTHKTRFSPPPSQTLRAKGGVD